MEALTIQKLFDAKNRKFRIPAYQRAYSWEEKQIKQLIEDLENAGNHYYLGHFLFEKSEEENTLLIIDGQQRLTTCIIFFRCIYDALKGKSDCKIDLDDIEDYYLRDLRKGTQKFETVEQDNNFFIDVIIEGKNRQAETKSQERISKAKDLFTACFKGKATPLLESWVSLIQDAAITEYVVSDKIQATQIFAFQNDRGKKLSNLEIVKSFFMLQIYLKSENPEIAESHIKYIEKEFSDIYSLIARINTKENEVLNYYWRAVSGKGFESGDIVDEVKKQILEINDIKKFVSNLTVAFRTIEKIEKSTEESISDLRYLNNLSLSMPFFIKADICNVSSSVFSRLAKFLENITFRSLLRGGRADIQSRINDLLKDSSDDNSFNIGIENKLVWYFKKNEWWNYWSDAEMIRILNGWFYNNRVDNYLLWKYELHLCDKNHPRPHGINFNELMSKESIEHIAPQNPTDGDPTSNGYGIYESKETPEEGIISGGWLNCVGNLMLISQSHNSSIGNKPFSEKLISYGKTNLLNQQKEIVDFVADPNNPVWDVESIKRRQNKIIEAALQIWNWERI